ncbi:MAG: TraB/GumN family protein, partial [Bacteroidota bacterium]
MTKYVLPVCLAVSFLTLSFSISTAQNHELLWRISGNGLTKASYLFGTIHVKDQRAFQFSDSVLSSIDKVDRLLIEVDPDSLTGYVLEAVDSTTRERSPLLSTLLSKDDFKFLTKKVRKQLKIDINRLRASRIDFLKKLLGLVKEKEDDRPTFLDVWLYELAQGWGKEVGGLEYVENHVAPTVLRESNPDYQAKANRLVRELKGTDKENMLDFLLGAYQKGDLNAIEKHNDMRAFLNRLEHEQLLTIRNQQMVERGKKLIREKSTFMAVGVAHLPGEDGLIELFRKEGFTVEAVPASFTGLAAKLEARPRAERPLRAFRSEEFGFAIKAPCILWSKENEGNGTHAFAGLDIGRMDSYVLMDVPGRTLGSNEVDETIDGMVNRMRRMGNGINEDVEIERIEFEGLAGVDMFQVELPSGVFANYRYLLRKDHVYCLAVSATKPARLKELSDDFFPRLELLPLQKKPAFH